MYERDKNLSSLPFLPGPESCSEGGDGVADGQQHGGRDRRTHKDLPEAAKHLPQYDLIENFDVPEASHSIFPIML